MDFRLYFYNEIMRLWYHCIIIIIVVKLCIYNAILWCILLTGNFEVGKEFDALVINSSAPGGAYDPCGTTDIEKLVQKFLYCGDDRNITEVYVAGEKINF